ncbi:dTDP-4-dehydrorhamnose 3,5-epimerase [Patiriisocius marinistellae]|uniref:dTDP-4-dehydrorhamnose 3,5-epimerase n=1 Tax=Patiriisocius marinistellae TaxID=2494560 RepID=A0A5J4FYV5_9FLAO|nr:dTDP-4-dehydrorhamnose 3,5-epimerase [Patiriisocius marinistellae]GEQ84861.1 dTDP-4-dehydrorhamnose 3,5-epimerase [Patiriisocius marinistellae]
MEIEKTNLKGSFIITPRVFEDERGTFTESFNTKAFAEITGINPVFVQDNQSISKYGVVRGLHGQLGEMAQAKLVRVIKGKVLDVAVDMRRESETFGQHFSIILSAENRKQLFVPRGFLHGFSVLEDDSIFAYKCDNFYDKESEAGIVYNDATLGIDWHLEDDVMIVSEKDAVLPSFKEMYKK